MGFEMEGELDLPFGMISGALTPRNGAIDPTVEANYRKDLMASIDKLEELRQKYVDRAITTMSEDDKAVLAALTETIQGIMQGQIAIGMGMQGRAQALQVLRGGMDETFHQALAVPDQQAMADINMYASTFSSSAAALAQSPDFRRQLATIVKNKGGLYVTDASGKPMLDESGQTQFNPEAVAAVSDYVENKAGGLGTVANITQRLLKLDPGTRANTGMEAARLARAAAQDGVRVMMAAAPETFGVTEQDANRLADITGARMSDRVLADIGVDASKVALTQQDQSKALLDRVYTDLMKIGVGTAGGAEIAEVMKRAHDNYKNGRLGERGSKAVFNAVNADVPYYDEKIAGLQGKIDRLDNKAEPNIHRLADPILRETDRMRAMIPAFDVFQTAMRFPTAERAAVWTSRFPQALKMVNDAAAQNPSLLADPDAVRALLRKGKFPVTPIERAAYSFKPNQPLLPTGKATAEMPDLGGVAVAEPTEAQLSAAADAMPAMEGTATVEPTAAELKAAEKAPDLTGTATVDPTDAELEKQAETAPDLKGKASVGESFTGRGGTEYTRNADGSYTVTASPMEMLVGMTIDRNESPDMWATIAKEHNEAAVSEMESQPTTKPTETAPAQMAAAPPPAQPQAPLPVRQAPTEQEAADDLKRRTDALRVPGSPQADDGKSEEGKAEEGDASGASAQASPGAPTGAPPALTSEDPAAAAASTTQTPPATLAGYGAARHQDAALASAFAGRYRRPEVNRG